MKKLLCLLLAVMLLVACTACGETETAKKTNDSRITDEGTSKATEGQTPATVPGTVVEDATQPEAQVGDPIIISVIVYHGSGEITENRMSAKKGDLLTEVLLGRTFMTEDMLTVDGERAYPEQGLTWSLYVDGVFTTEAWDTITVDNGVEYAFEYTSELEPEGEPGAEDYEGPVEEEFSEDDSVGESGTEDTTAET